MSYYRIREVFLTLQGEGARVGCKSAFVRFVGCNLWNGRPEDRAKGLGACAAWCDTDFVGGQSMTTTQLLEALDGLWPKGQVQRWCVLTGGEPLLQVDSALLAALDGAAWNTAVETNGTLPLPDGRISWVTVSPKQGASCILHGGQELKVVLPGGAPGWTDYELERLGAGCWEHRFVQPQDPGIPTMVGATYLHRRMAGARAEYAANLRRCVAFVLAYPEWRLSQQAHKFADLP